MAGASLGSGIDRAARRFSLPVPVTINPSSERSAEYCSTNRANNGPRRFSRSINRLAAPDQPESIQFIEALPDQLQLVIEGLRIIMGHGAPWDDFTHVAPDSRPALLRRVA